MLIFEDLRPGLTLVGLEPAALASLLAVVPIAEDTVQVINETSDGTLKDRLLNRDDGPNISQTIVERPWPFDGNRSAFQLTCEAKRINLALLFDQMVAFRTSNAEPLSNRIASVDESMLPQQPLRFVLADNPGAGNTTRATFPETSNRDYL